MSRFVTYDVASIRLSAVAIVYPAPREERLGEVVIVVALSRIPVSAKHQRAVGGLKPGAVVTLWKPIIIDPIPQLDLTQSAFLEERLARRSIHGDLDLVILNRILPIEGWFVELKRVVDSDPHINLVQIRVAIGAGSLVAVGIVAVDSADVKVLSVRMIGIGGRVPNNQEAQRDGCSECEVQHLPQSRQTQSRTNK